MNSSVAKLLDLDAIAAERARRALALTRRKIDTYFPAEGELARDRYVKHLEFFRAGRLHRERLFMAGNRVGKTDTGLYEDVLHLTGEYPDWWEGRRFNVPIEAWLACETNALTRDVLQAKLMGPSGNYGIGFLPFDSIVHTTRKSGIADALDTVFIRHRSGGVSACGFKSYAEGRENFQGTAKHLVHFDEEPTQSVYVEANLRTMIVPGTPDGGLMIVTFTPLNGHTEVVDSFLNSEFDRLVPSVPSVPT